MANNCDMTGIAYKISEEKGDKWVKDNCGSIEPTTPAQISNLVFNHFLESAAGERVVWGESEEIKRAVESGRGIHYVLDIIYKQYVNGLEWMNQEEWMAVADNFYGMIDKRLIITTKIVESAHLYFQEGSSDKVYYARLETDGVSFSVHFSYGRRGGNMTEGYKVQEVPEDVARKEYDKLIASKVKKGYRHS